MDTAHKMRFIISDVTAWLGFSTLGLGLALTAQGFKNMKPKPWAELWDGLGWGFFDTLTNSHDKKIEISQ